MIARRTFLATTTAAALAAAPALAAPASRLIAGPWQSFGGTPAMDHSAWAGFLSRHVRPGPDGVARVDYAAAKGDHAALEGYVAQLEATDPTQLSRDAAMAYWINLYNAKTVDIILDNYPVASIRDIGGGLFSRGPWDDEVVTVDYAAAKGDHAALEGYVAQLEATDPTQLSRDAAMAYWINLYNAKTVDIILDNYPVASIRDIGGGLFSRGPWDDEVVTVAGQRLSLNDIEHGILRPVWGDPRIHYAVNCASIGCPDLAAQPYTAANLQGMLDQAARAYVNHPRGARVDGGRLTVSSIYEWYQSDFGASDQGVIAHLRQYAEPGLAGQLASVSSVYDDAYDWSLNDVR